MFEQLVHRYRATGADLPFGNPLADHGVGMEGWFWRITDAANQRVLIALCGLQRPRSIPEWAMTGLAAHPMPGGGRTGQLVVRSWDGGQALPRGARVSAGDEFWEADDRHLHARLDGIEVDLRLDQVAPWPQRLWGGSSLFQTVPGLNQYWHPWLLGGRVSGTVRFGESTWQLADAQLYAEKNWGRGGFPESWWWGQAQGFVEPQACVAFAGGRIHLGLPDITRPGNHPSLDVTALVTRLPDGRVLRLGNPGTSPVRTTLGDGTWTLRGRNLAGWSVEVDAAVPLERAFVLPVPIVDERREQPGCTESLVGDLAVRVSRRGELVWQGTTTLAGLEAGSLQHAEQALAAREGDPRPSA